MVSSVSDSKSSLGIIKDFFTLTLIFFKYSLIVQPPNYYPAWGIVHCTFLLISFQYSFLLFSFHCSFLLLLRSLYHSTFIRGRATIEDFVVPFYFRSRSLFHFTCFISLYLFTHTHFIVLFYFYSFHYSFLLGPTRATCTTVFFKIN